MRSLLILFALSISLPSIAQQIVFLGNLQDAGAPQFNCDKSCCLVERPNEFVASIGVYSEEEAFTMIFREFMLTGAKNSNWEDYFVDIFGFSVNEFYDSLQSYPLNLEDIVPSTSLSLTQIFN